MSADQRQTSQPDAGQPRVGQPATSGAETELVDRSNFANRVQDLLDSAEDRARKRQHAKGRKTARERIDMLLDEGSFQEIHRFAGGDLDKGFLAPQSSPALEPWTVARSPFAPGLLGPRRHLGEVEGRKITHLMRQAVRLRIPIISMLDSGGARIQEGVGALAQYGEIFKATTEASGLSLRFR